jgi:hypothetical protein
MRSASDLPIGGDTAVGPNLRFFLHAGSTFGPGAGDGDGDGGEIEIETKIETRVYHGPLVNYGSRDGIGTGTGAGVQRFVLLSISS